MAFAPPDKVVLHSTVYVVRQVVPWHAHILSGILLDVEQRWFHEEDHSDRSPSMSEEATPLTISVPEAGKQYFGLSRNGSYDAARRGEIPTIKIGKLLRVPVRALEQMLDGASAKSASAWPAISSATDWAGVPPKENRPPRTPAKEIWTWEN
jgi:hypothetical protein